MKKLFLAATLFLFMGVSYSQKYQPIDSTLVWNTSNSMRIASGFCCYVNEDASFQFKGFVLNNGNTWLKLFESALYTRVACFPQCTDGTVPGNFTNSFRGYLMNDSVNKKVYFTSTLTANYTPTTSNIVYDFDNKNIGDSLNWKPILSPFSMPNIPKFKILTIDSFSFAGKYHKRYSVVNNTIFSPTRIIYVMEGMGSSLGPWNSIFTDFEFNSSLTCFSKPQNAVSVTSYTNFVPTSAPYCATINVVPEFETAIFTVYPNPVKNLINLENINVNSISIFDVVGKLVIEQSEIHGSINVESLLPGTYFLKIRTNNRIYSSKFIKE
ncbi:MAG: T9SS type A sorting domain-containing protein [Bacteroidota bacterium]|nr:T9SS type A sorting domain-containing protein [Bacteroidota bacterium]MDP3144881.1 T9SS type A sorting domain-containing protein [Bacteroidota bacterium]MDP3557109.1 T9SS type A sorting domain-containing protein [Bacteroidota bacterium]